MIRQTAHPTPPCHPCGLDPQPDPVALVHLDGAAKQSLETGRTRLLVTGLVFALAFFVIGLRLVEVSLLYDDRESRQAARGEAAAARSHRADIVDRNGFVLATSLPSASLYANPRQIRNPARVAAQLSRALPDLSVAVLTDKLSGDGAFVYIKRNVTPREQDAVNRLGIPGLNFETGSIRVYPHGPLVAHTVGFTDIDGRGLAGIEQSFNSLLRDSADPLALSLDLRLQHIVTEELAAAMAEFHAIGASGVVLDVESGEVLSMVSLPSFDSNEPGTASEDARFNRASLGLYEMGSVFKIFTTAMALDSGAVSLQDGYDVSKPIRVARFTINDYKPKNRWLSVPEIFMYSSNIGTVQMALAAGTPLQQRYLERFGLTRPSAIELPESGRPMLPSPWREINTMTISYGHGLAVSPLQLANAVAAVINGGELLPATLLKREPGERPVGERVISEETSRAMRWMMRLVVQHGTGRKADAAGLLVGGKTGTSDKLAGGHYVRNARIASFVGAFPIERPRYVVFAMIDEPKGNKSTYGYATGGWVAAPVIRRVVERMAPMYAIQPHTTQEAADIDSILIPATVKGLALAAD
ncbi:MAG: peptidoglycan D,D-transpeptidase FtsI family protein [Kiloniellales bacterium]